MYRGYAKVQADRWRVFKRAILWMGPAKGDFGHQTHADSHVRLCVSGKEERHERQAAEGQLEPAVLYDPDRVDAS